MEVLERKAWHRLSQGRLEWEEPRNPERAEKISTQGRANIIDIVQSRRVAV